MSTVSKRSILVLGCGALGGALIDRFTRCAHVTVVDPSPRVRVKIRILHNTDGLKGRSFDGLIVATKCYAIDKALMPLKGHVHFRRVLFLQNGIIDLSRMPRSFPEAAVVRGVTTSAIGISSRRSVFHFQGDFYLAPGGGKNNEAVNWFGRLFKDAGLRTTLVSHASRIIWAKLIFSAVMNPLPVITGQGYDVLKKDPDVWRSVRRAVEEGRMVARHLGIRLAFDPLDLILRVRDGDLAGISHRGTIYQDISTRRPTELDFITGALVRQARQARVKTPTLEVLWVKARMAGG